MQLRTSNDAGVKGEWARNMRKLKMTPHTGKNNDAPTIKVFTKRQ